MGIIVDFLSLIKSSNSDILQQYFSSPSAHTFTLKRKYWQRWTACYVLGLALLTEARVERIVVFLCCKNPVLIEYFTNYLRTDIAECEADTCHHGQCTEKRYGGTVCKCDTGYMGEDCSININECAAQPCLNGGECNDLVNGYTCDCASAYTGDTCNIGKLVRYN